MPSATSDSPPPDAGPDSAAARRRHRAALVLLWLVPAVWSSNYLIARAAGPHVPPHVLAFGRWGIVFVLLLAASARSIAADPSRLVAEWRRSLVLGALGMWICGAWVYVGGHTTTATNIGLIYAAAPVGIALGGAWLLGERLTPAQRIAMPLALVGVLFVVAHGDPASLLAVRFSAGDLWIVAATLSWTAYSLLLQRWPTRLSATERLCCMAAGGLVLMAPFVAWELATLARPLDARALQLIALAALLPGLVSYLAYGFLQRELGVARAGLVLYLAPVYVAGLAWWILGEPPRWCPGRRSDPARGRHGAAQASALRAALGLSLFDGYLISASGCGPGREFSELNQQVTRWSLLDGCLMRSLMAAATLS